MGRGPPFLTLQRFGGYLSVRVPITVTSARRLQSLLGVLPLGLYLVLHAWELRAAPRGVEAFAGSVAGVRGGVAVVVLETVLVILPLLVHAGLGLFSIGRPSGPGERSREAYGSAGYLALQRVTGLLTLGFLALHVGETWVRKVSGATAEGVYETLLLDAGTPFGMVLYVVGITAASFHLGQGLGAALVTWGFATEPGGIRVARLVGGIVATAVWTLCLNAFAFFAAGSALF